MGKSRHPFLIAFVINNKIVPLRETAFLSGIPTPGPSPRGGEFSNYFGIGWAIGPSNPKIIGRFVYENSVWNTCE
jgi:hypothetical protein